MVLFSDLSTSMILNYLEFTCKFVYIYIYIYIYILIIMTTIIGI